MTDKSSISADLLKIDCARELRYDLRRDQERAGEEPRERGLVVGISGGIDSSVTAALCVRAVGKDKVIGLQMPERHSAGDTLGLGDSSPITWGPGRSLSYHARPRGRRLL